MTQDTLIPPGVYLDRSGRTCIVTRISPRGFVVFIPLAGLAVRTKDVFGFLHDYTLWIPDYPLLRAIASFREFGRLHGITDRAKLELESLEDWVMNGDLWGDDTTEGEGEGEGDGDGEGEGEGEGEEILS